MLKKFTPEYIRKNKGCYNLEQVNNLSFIKKEEISIEDILKSEISIKDKRWFLYNKCNLDLNQRKRIALEMAKVVSDIYLKKYPNDTRVSDCLEATEKYLDNKITYEDLRVFKDNCWNARREAYADYAAYADAAYAAAAYAAAYAADAAAAYADAAYAAADAAAYAAAYAAAAYAAADAAAYADAAYAAAYAAEPKKSYKERLVDTLINFVNKQE